MKADDRKLVENTILQLATVLREKAYARYVLNREDYQREMEEFCAKDEEYMRLELTEQQRKVIDDMLDRREDATDRELTWSYLVGMLDVLVFLRKTGFLEMVLREDEQTEEVY